jgi:predicted YcjX-like family ATPase
MRFLEGTGLYLPGKTIFFTSGIHQTIHGNPGYPEMSICQPVLKPNYIWHAH